MKTTINELSSSMGKVIPTANANSVALEQLGASYALLTANGIATAESGTYLSSMLNELGKTGTKTDVALRELTGKSFKELMEEGSNLSEVLGILSQYAEDSGVNLTDLFGSAEAGKAVLTLTKNEGKDFVNMLGEMENSLGTTNEAFKKVDETTGNKLNKSINNLKNAFLETGDNLAPVVDKISNAIVEIAEAIGEMDEATISNTIKLAGWGVAIGTAGKAIGGTVSTVGTLATGLSKLCGLLGTTSTATTAVGTSAGVGATGVAGLTTSFGGLSAVALPIAGIVGAIATGFYAVNEANDLMNSNILKTTDDMSLMEKGMASLLGVQKYSKDELVDMGLAYKDFNENISTEFKNKVNESEEALRDFSLYLREINFDNVLSEEESADFNNRVNAMVNGAIATMEGKKEESNKALKELFLSDGIISESEQKTLDFLNKNYDTNISETNKLKDEIYKIKQQAIDEQRGLNEQEIADVEAKLSEIRRLELESIGGNEEELAYAKNEFNARMASIDLQGASDLLVEKSKIRDNEIVNIKASYDTQIDMLKGKLSLATGEEKKAIESEIANLEQSKNDKIKIQDDLYDEFLRILGEKNPQILDQINRYNGEILDNTDKANQKSLESMKNRYDGINKITETGMYNLYDKVSKTNKDVFVNIDKNTGEIIGVYDKLNGTVSGYTKEISDNTVRMGNQYKATSQQVKQDLESMNGASINSKNQIVGANGQVITSLQNVTTNANGTKSALADINGRTYKVNFNENGAIWNLQSIINKIDWINRNPASVVVKGGMTMEQWAVGTPSANEDTIATVNEKGWELINTKPNSVALSLGRTLQGESAFIPQGTKISTNLSSTQQMKQAVTNEVNRQVSNGLTEDIALMAKTIVKAINESYAKDISVTNEFNIENNTEFDVEKTQKSIENVMKAEIRRFGRIV